MRSREITEYNRLTWPEMNGAIELQKVVLLPTGSTEQHGPRLPPDTDLFLVESVCREPAKRAPDKEMLVWLEEYRAWPIEARQDQHRLPVPRDIRW